MLFKSLPSPRLPSAWSVYWSGTTQTERSRSGSYGLRSRAITVGTCTESTIPTRGKETQPIGLKPDIILYRNRIINIYIHTYIYNYDWLYICTITHRYIHSFKSILLKGVILLTYLETLQRPAVLACVLMETPLYLLYYHSNFDSWLSVWLRKDSTTPPPPHPSKWTTPHSARGHRTTKAHISSHTKRGRGERLIQEA